MSDNDWKALLNVKKHLYLLMDFYVTNKATLDKKTNDNDKQKLQNFLNNKLLLRYVDPNLMETINKGDFKFEDKDIVKYMLVMKHGRNKDIIIDALIEMEFEVCGFMTRCFLKGNLERLVHYLGQSLDYFLYM